MTSTRSESRISRGLRAWARSVLAHPLWVLAGFAVLVAASLWAAVGNLRISTDTSAMLADSLPWRQQQIRLDAAFPDRTADVLLIVDGATAQQALDATRRLDAALRTLPVVADSFSSATSDYFRRNRLLFLSPQQLESLIRQLSQAQPLLGRLRTDPSLSGFADTMTRLARQDAPPPEVGRLLHRLGHTAEALARGDAARLDWQALLSPADQPPTRQLLSLTLTGGAGRAALAELRRVLDAQMADQPGVVLRMTGALPLKLDELDAARDGAALAAGLSLLAVLVLLGVGLRSAAMVAACLISLLVGLTLTAGFAAVAVGRLNLISVAFSALHIGLAVDYAVHLCMHLRSPQGTRPSVADAVADVGGSLLLCTLTTSVAFLAFLLTDYRGVAELGLIAGAGIVIGLLTSITLLPVLLQLFRARPRPLRRPADAAARTPLRGRRWVQAGAAAVALAAALAATELRFAYNPVHLKPAQLESVSSFDALARDGDAPLHAEALRSDQTSARMLAEAMQGLPTVGRVLWLASFVPQAVDDKLPLIDDLLLTSGSTLTGPLVLEPVQPERARPALQTLADAMTGSHAEAAAGLRAWLASAPTAGDWQALQSAWLGDLPGLLADLGAGLDPTAGTLDAIPNRLRRRWQRDEAGWLLRIMPSDNVNRDTALHAFVRQVQSVEPNVSGPAVTYIEAGKSVQLAFIQAFGTALLAISLLLVVLMGSPADAARGLLPLLLGTLVLLALAAQLPIPLNFANIIALPLLLGVAVDNGVHMIWRARQGVAPSALVRSATGRAVVLSALTTLASFSALAFSAHRGMASMGQLLGLGLLVTLVCTLCVLPALLPHQTTATRSDTA